MNVLIVVGYCLKINSSANLCHISYIKGLIDNGHMVDLITVSDKNLCIDNSMTIPKVRNIFEYDCSKYEQLANKKNVVNKNIKKSRTKRVGVKVQIKSFLKKKIRKLYGVYGLDSIWCKNASKFYAEERYDCIISLAYPPVSHYLVEKLIKKNRVKTKKWIQIWEDPWSSDLALNETSKKVIREEKRIVDKADKVFYVSPLTLIYQKEKFNKSSSKMYWQPLPSYYKDSNNEQSFDEICFGYFGDYNSRVRNILPFYEAATEISEQVYICGNTDLELVNRDNIDIYPRLSLEELKQFEKKANVLVFLCNLNGGQIPGKIYQYAATNKMVLFILDGKENEKEAIKDYFSKFNRFIFCDNEKSEIIKAINKLKDVSSIECYTRPLLDFEPKKIIEQILEG